MHAHTHAYQSNLAPSIFFLSSSLAWKQLPMAAEHAFPTEEEDTHHDNVH